MTTIYELANLQGLPRAVLDRMMRTSQTLPSIGAAIGDAMSINVLMRLLPAALRAAGLVDGDYPDVWRRAHTVTGRLPDALYMKHGCLTALVDE